MTPEEFRKKLDLFFQERWEGDHGIERADFLWGRILEKIKVRDQERESALVKLCRYLIALLEPSDSEYQYATTTLKDLGYDD